MVLPGPARVSVWALRWLLDSERIGDPHLVLAPAAVWHAQADREALDAQARKEISALGWYDGRGRVEIEVAAALTMVCRGEVEFFGWITCGDKTIGVLAGGIGRQGLLAVRDGESVWLNHVGGGRLAEAVVGQTPDVPAGQGKPVMAARGEVVGSVRGRRLTEAAVRVDTASVAVRRIQQLVALPLTGKGELYAAMRDGLGRYRVSEPVRYADTEDGRYLNVAVDGDRVLVAPVSSRADLVARLKGRSPAS